MYVNLDQYFTLLFVCSNSSNSLYHIIISELVFSERELHVLDHTLYLIDGFIKTDVYSKPIDSHLYLPPFSCHPKHVFNAIPFGVATRLREIALKKFFLPREQLSTKSTLLRYLVPCFEVAMHFARIPHTLGDFSFQYID